MSICNSLHIELHLICRIVLCILPCHVSLNRTCIILDCASCHVDVVVVYHDCFAPFRCCFFGLVLITSRCEDPFVYVRLSSSWTRSSSLWDFRQDDHTLEITTILAMLVCPLFAMPMLRRLPFSCQPPKLPCQTSNPPCPSKPLIGYVTALLSPSYSVVSCR